MNNMRRYAKTVDCRHGDVSVTMLLIRTSLIVLTAITQSVDVFAIGTKKTCHENTCNFHIINRTGCVRLRYVAHNTILLMGIDTKEQKLEVIYQCDAFKIVIRDDWMYGKEHRLERPGHPILYDTLEKLLLEVYEDTNIWLTNEQRQQLKQLRHGILK